GLVPSSRKERELVEEARSSDALAKATEEVRSAAKETAEHLREPAQQAVQDVKDTATEGAQPVREEGTGAAQDGRAQAEASGRTVPGAHRTGRARALRDEGHPPRWPAERVHGDQ